MIICLEGVDGSGKTTLCNQLKERFKCDVYKFNRNEDDLLYKYRCLAFGYSNKLVLLDRSFLTDLVYRIQDGQKTDIGLMDMLMLLNYMIVIHCDNDQAYRKSMERGEDNITDSSLSQKIRETYNQIYNILEISHNINLYRYNYFEQNEQDVIKYIENVCNEKGVIYAKK